jgi:hypothetical protein
VLRDAPQADDVRDHQVELGLRLLLDDRDATCHVPASHSGEIGPVEQHLTAARGADAGQQPQQRRLARAVRPEEADHASGLDVERDAVDDASTADDPRDVAGRQAHAGTRRR